jgi:hypothetical protein
MSHTGNLLSGQVTCSCTWVSKRAAVATDAIDEFDQHVHEETVVVPLARIICRPYLQGVVDTPCYVCRDAVRRLGAAVTISAPSSGHVTEEKGSTHHE